MIKFGSYIADALFDAKKQQEAGLYESKNLSLKLKESMLVINTMDSKELSENYKLFIEEISTISENTLNNSFSGEENPAYYAFKNLISKFQEGTDIKDSHVNLLGLKKINMVLNGSYNELDDKKRESIENVKKLCETDARYVMLNIKSFNISSQDDLFEIAKLCIQFSPSSFPIYIQNFQIQEEKKRMELALLCINVGAITVLNSIKNFDISTYLIDVAKKLAEKCPARFSYSVSKIQKEEDRIELAKICVKHAQTGDRGNLGSILKNLIQFNINHHAVIEIVKMGAKKDVAATSKQLEFLKITEPNELIELAWFCARQDGYQTAANIANFKITDQILLKEIFKECALQAGMKMVPPLPSKFQNQFAENCWKLLIKNDLENAIKSLKDWGNELFKDTSISKLCDNISKIENTRLKIEKLSLLVEALFLCDFCLSKDQLQMVKDEHLLSMIFDFPGPNLRLPLFQILVVFLQLNNYSKTVSLLKNIKKERDWMKLSRLLLGGLCSKGMSLEIAAKVISETSTGSLFYKGENQKIFIEFLLWFGKDEHLTAAEKEKVFQHIFNDAEATLKTKKTAPSELDQAAEIAKKKIAFAIKLEQLSQQDEDLNFKLQTVGKIFNEFPTKDLAGKLKNLFNEKLEGFAKAGTVEELNSEIKKFLEIFASKKNRKSWERTIQDNKPYTRLELEVQILRNMGSVLAILQINPPALKSIEVNLQQTLEASVRSKLPLGKVDDFASKYLDHFKSSGQSLMTYFAQLATLEDDQAIKTLGNYVTAVLNGTFEKVRNDISQNLHLKTINEAQPKLLKLWQQPLEPKELIFNDKKGKPVKHTLIDSSDPIDILLIGKCGNTCQWVANAPQLSRGLLGYLMDGKNRFLILKDEEGEVVARCLLRLLWDGEKAVIYKEPSYPDTLSIEHRNVLIEMSQAKAKNLDNTTLVVNAYDIFDDNVKLYEKNLMALGSSIPYEYSDATPGVEKWGIFTVKRSFLMNTTQTEAHSDNCDGI